MTEYSVNNSFKCILVVLWRFTVIKSHTVWMLLFVTVCVDAVEIRCVGDPYPGRSSGWTSGHWQNAGGATTCWHHQRRWVNAHSHATLPLFSFLSLLFLSLPLSLQFRSLLIFPAWAWAACTPTGHEWQSLLFLLLPLLPEEVRKARTHAHTHTHRGSSWISGESGMASCLISGLWNWTLSQIC